MRTFVRLLADHTDPPLGVPEMRHLLDLLRTDTERAVVGRWLNEVPRLRRSDLVVVEQYALERDMDLTDADLADELDQLRALGSR